MRHVPSRRPLFLDGKRYTWTGATWALSGGRAYNTPTLGSELLTNNGFASDTVWTKDPGWTIAADVASHTTPIGALYQVAHTSGNWYRLLFDIIAYTSGNVYAVFGGSALGLNRSAIGSYTQTGRAMGVGAGIGATGTTSVDNASSKQITLSTLPATVVGVAGQTVTAKLYTITSSTQAGIIYGLDSVTTPQNCVIAYHDGTGVTVDKLISGVWSNVIPRVTVAFSTDFEIELRPLGSDQYDLLYGGTKRGSTATITGITGVNHGLFSTYSSNLFSEFRLNNKIIPLVF